MVGVKLSSVSNCPRCQIVPSPKVCICHLTANVPALKSEQKDTTSQPYFTFATCCPFDLFRWCNLILSFALESSVFTLCSSNLELTKVRRAPNFTTICPEKQGEERICRQGQARPDSGGSRGGRPPMYQYMYGFTGLSLFLTLSMAFCKDFLLLSNEYLIKQKLKPQISKLTHVPFCTDLQT